MVDACTVTMNMGCELGGIRAVDNPYRRGLLLSFLFVGSLTIVSVQGPATTNARADLAPGGRIKILSESRHQRFTDWGYDIKQPNKAERLASDANLATRIFSDVDDNYGMDILRIPIYAHAHSADGTDLVCGTLLNTGEVDPEDCPAEIDNASWDYEEVFDAVHAARRVKPSVSIFASIKSIEGIPDSYPTWVKKADGTVYGPQYADLLCRYLEFMEARDIRIDVLGPDNEGTIFRGDISPRKHDTIVNWLSVNCPVPLPKIIGPERWSPSDAGLNSITAGEWLNKLFIKGWWDAIDFAGTHYFSRFRTDPSYAAKLATFARHTNPTGVTGDGRTQWNSEFHWQECIPARDEHCINQPVGSDPHTTYWDAKLGLMAAFDNFDSGFQGMTWWNFAPWTEPTTPRTWNEDELRSQMVSELVRSTTDAYPLEVDDQDGSPMDRKLFNTRAFKLGTDVVLWVINDTNADAVGKWIEVPGKDIDNDSTSNAKAVIGFTRWDNTSRTHGTAELDENLAAGPGSDESIFKMDFPKKTVTVIRVPDVYSSTGG
jgi:hypothetical protein